MFRSIPQEDDDFSPEEPPMHKLDKNSSSSSGTAGTTKRRGKWLSSYQELPDVSDGLGQAEDETALEKGGSSSLSRCQPLELHIASAEAIEASGQNHDSNYSSAGAAGELSASKDQQGGDREPGLLGSDGLLAVPHVKMLLLLGVMIYVRQDATTLLAKVHRPAFSESLPPYILISSTRLMPEDGRTTGSTCSNSYACPCFTPMKDQ